MLESTKELVSLLFFQISAFLGRVTVPGMEFTFKTFFIGIFLFAMLVMFLRGFFGFGDSFAPAELGKLTGDKIRANRKNKIMARRAAYEEQLRNEARANDYARREEDKRIRAAKRAAERRSGKR